MSQESTNPKTATVKFSGISYGAAMGDLDKGFHIGGCLDDKEPLESFEGSKVVKYGVTLGFYKVPENAQANAVSSVEIELKKAFEKAGIPAERLHAEVRQDYRYSAITNSAGNTIGGNSSPTGKFIFSATYYFDPKHHPVASTIVRNIYENHRGKDSTLTWA